MLYHRAWNTTHGSEEFKVLTWSQQIEKDIMLRADPRHAAYRSHIVGVAHIIAEYESCASGRWSQTRENVEKSGFAGAVMSEDGGDLALVNGKIDAVHSLDLRFPAFVIWFVEIGYSDCFAALHFAYYWLHVAIRFFARDEGVWLAVRWWYLKITLWKRWPYSHSPNSSMRKFLIEEKEKKIMQFW